MIQTVDNYYLSNIEVIPIQKEREAFLNTNSYYCLSNITVKNEMNITLKDYRDKKYPNNTFFSFFKGTNLVTFLISFKSNTMFLFISNLPKS